MRQKLVLDACILYPHYVRDFVLRLAERRLYTPYWSPQIEKEWTEKLKENRPGLEASIERTRILMNKAFPDALKRNFPMVQADMPDPDDIHVLSLAIFIQADAIVTFNLKDFPQSALLPYDLEAIHPDLWIKSLIELLPFDVLETFKDWLKDLTKPALQPIELLTHMTNNGLSLSAEAIRILIQL